MPPSERKKRSTSLKKVEHSCITDDEKHRFCSNLDKRVILSTDMKTAVFRKKFKGTKTVLKMII